jgi:hypothetical protein
MPVRTLKLFEACTLLRLSRCHDTAEPILSDPVPHPCCVCADDVPSLAINMDEAGTSGRLAHFIDWVNTLLRKRSDAK